MEQMGFVFERYKFIASIRKMNAILSLSIYMDVCLCVCVSFGFAGHICKKCLKLVIKGSWITYTK